MVEHWYSVVYVAAYHCTTIIQIHHLFVKILNVSHYIHSFVKLTSTPPQLDVELTTSKHQVWKLLILNAILFLFIHLYAPAGTGEIYE